MRLIRLAEGRTYHTHHGAIEHDDLIGGPDGVVIASSKGMSYVVLRPLLADEVLAMPRGAAVVYPKDAAQILLAADIFPGARVVEAGAGSGALSMALLRAVGDDGLLHSFEARTDFADIAQRNVEAYFGSGHPAWRLTRGRLEAAQPDLPPDGWADRIVLDMVAPWECLGVSRQLLSAGGVLCCYVATTTQLSRTVEEMRLTGCFTEPLASETLVRTWHADGLAVRPDHRMVAHTGFLVTTRRLADGQVPPVRRRRPSKGAQVDTDTPAADAT